MNPIARSDRATGVFSILVIAFLLVAGFSLIAYGEISSGAVTPPTLGQVAGGLSVAAKSTGGTPSIVTLGNQERQDITAANQWAEGNIDYWLESHYYDTEVQVQAGSKSTATVPTLMDFAMSFYFSNKNAITIDWTQDWHVTLSSTTQFWTKTSAPAGASYTCPVPPGIVQIPKGGTSVSVPMNGSVCIQSVAANTTGNPTTGWLDLSSVSLATLNTVLPVRNEPCSSVSGGLCVSGTETESSPAGQHYFRVNFSAIFGPSGLSPQSWWPNLPAGMSIALYFRNHLAMTSVWDTGAGAAGGGSQPQFCINTTNGARLNTVYDRCDWTTVSRLGAGYAAGSSNHGSVNAPGIGQKTIPLPNVIAPTGYITIAKIVTDVETDTTGALGTLTDGWNVTVTGPFQTNQTHVTGSYTTGMARFGPLFPTSGYMVSEELQSGYVQIGTVVSPSTDRTSGTNPTPDNPVNVSISIAEATSASGPAVTFVNFLPAPGLNETCRITIRDSTGSAVNRTYAIAGDNIEHNYTVTNTGNVALNVTQNHTDTTDFGPNPLFQGWLAPGASHSTLRNLTVTTGMSGTLVDNCASTGVSSYGTGTTSSSNDCSVVVKEPSISFTKYPQAGDHVTAISGDTVTYAISVTNSGDADAVVNVTDALGVGQTLLLGGALTGTGDLPTVTPTSPTSGFDYTAPATIEWGGLAVAAGTTIYLNFTVLVTATVQGTELTGEMTLTAANTNGVDYTPDPNNATNLVTVLAPQLSFTKYPQAGDNVTTLSHGYVTYRITVTNSGDASATVNVTDALGLGQTLLNGGVLTGTGQLPSVTPTSPAAGSDYAAPATIEWDGLAVAAGTTIWLNFTVYVTATTQDYQLTGLMTLTAVNANGVSYTPSDHTADNLVTVLAPNVSFTKYPQAGDHVTTLSGGYVTYTITVSNTGDAAAVVNVSDALGLGQTLLNGGVLTGAGQLPSVSPTSPSSGADYAAPTTVEWDGLNVGVGETIYLNFTVLVTATTQDYQLTGTMTLTAANTNGVDYTPDPNTAGNLVTVLAPNVSFTKYPVASDNLNVVPGGCFQVNITVSNTGDAAAVVTVTDALAAGQTLLNGGAGTCGTPSPALDSPASGSDYAAPVTAEWDGITVDVNASVTLTFWVLVTATTMGAELTGEMNLTAANVNGVDYTPTTHTAQDVVTVVRPILKLTSFGYTNTPNGTPTSGIVNGTTVYTVTFTNYGDNESYLSGYLNVTYAGAGAGSVTCWEYTGPASLSGCSLSWTNVLLAPYGEAGNSVTFTLTVSYADMASGATVDARLAATYVPTVGGETFLPSGVPAMIEFTVEGM